MQSVMSGSHSFAQVPEAEIQRSSFDRSHGLKTTFDAGYLVPIYLELDVLPGDTFNLNLTAFARMATPMKPIMDNLAMDFFFFFVPYRLLWTNFQKFMGEQVNPGDSTSFVVPQVTGPAAPGILSGSLADYFGLPVGKAAVVYNAFAHRSYNRIWNEWFRDENLQISVPVDMGDGPDSYGNYVLKKRGKRHDYFTSCLPWPQKGTAVSIPLGTSAPVIGIATQNAAFTSGALVDGFQSDGTLVSWAQRKDIYDGTAAGTVSIQQNPANGYPWIRADLTNATAATINSLRQAFQLQRLYERDARGGTRYTEILRSHFGVISPDARLQRSEYLGGGSIPVNINPVTQTSVTAATPQGNMAAFGTASGSGVGFSKSFVEHGLVLGLVSVRADLTYQQGLERGFSRRTRFDYYWPALAHIGEQAVLNKEIYCNMDANDDLVFGYQERFAEYRYKPSKITGLFRSNVSAGSTSIDLWHLSQNFGSLPTLAATFIEVTPPMTRVLAVPTEPHFLYDSYIKLICARPMPVFGVPGLIDHF